MAVAALHRSTRLLRWAGSLEGQSLLASRAFGSSTVAGVAAGPGPAAPSDALADGSESLAAGGAAELLPGDGLADSLAVAAAATGAVGSSSEIGSILGATMAAVDGLHAATGLPWWATIASVGVLVRAAMFPVSLQGMKASASLMPLLRQAREEVSAAMRPPAPPPMQPPPLEQRDGKQQKQQKWQRSQQQTPGPGAAATGPLAAAQHGSTDGGSGGSARAQAGPVASNAAVLARFTQLRRAAGAPHPIWVLASPLAQLPVFITAMATVRTMSITGWPGFSSGGAAWFADLTMPALDLANMVAPMGTLGVVLPLGITVSMFANIDAAFSAPAGSKEQSSVMLWVTGSLRLFMEWMMVPIFAVALQIPHGALCYWATSSSLALLQNHALKQEAVRRLVGLPVGAPQPVTGAPPLRPVVSSAAAAAVAAGAAGRIPAGVDPELRQFLLTTSDQMALFEKAAALRAEGRAGATSTVLQRLLQLYPGQPNALYALGQVYAALKDWPLSEQFYLQAAQSSELEQQMQARAWFGAAVAMHMQHEDETAVDAFQKAAAMAQSDELRVRSWVSQATLHRKLGATEAAVHLLRKAARAEPKVEEVYLKPLLAELAEQQQQQQQQQRQRHGTEEAADDEAQAPLQGEK